MITHQTEPPNVPICVTTNTFIYINVCALFFLSYRFSRRCPSEGCHSLCFFALYSPNYILLLVISRLVQTGLSSNRGQGIKLGVRHAREGRFSSLFKLFHSFSSSFSLSLSLSPRPSSPMNSPRPSNFNSQFPFRKRLDKFSFERFEYEKFQ